MPGTYPIATNRPDYATCSVCVRIGTNATTTMSEHEYLATGDTVTITMAAPRSART